MYWMLLLSVLLFWLPALGPLIAGYVGGKKAGGTIRGIFAAILPTLLVGAAIFVIGAGLELPLIGAIAASVVVLYLLIHGGGVLIGALIGGALS